jgi:hypothetical protein
MKKRAHKRVSTSEDAELVYGVIKQSAVVGNISRNGLYIITTHSDIIREFTPGTEFKLNFRLPSGETINLLCVKRWSHRTSHHALTKSIGLELINPPREYTMYVEDLEKKPR